MTSPPAPLCRKRGNPLGNPTLNQSPRCGARTRSGCPCRGPAVHGGLRCRMHGGGSTGPRTAAGLARSRTARLRHGRCSAEARAQNRYEMTLQQRSDVFLQVVERLDRLPAALVVRVPDAPELAIPRRPTRGLSVREDQALRRQEAAALLPWRQAVRATRQRRSRKMDGPYAPVFHPADTSAAGRNRDEALAPVLAMAGSAAALWLGAGGASLASPSPEGAAPRAAPMNHGNAGAAARNADQPHAPVGDGRPAPATTPQDRQPYSSAGQVWHKAGHDGDSQVPAVMRGTLDEPHAPVSPPPGLTRQERKRWKWQQRQARKMAQR